MGRGPCVDQSPEVIASPAPLLDLAGGAFRAERQTTGAPGAESAQARKGRPAHKVPVAQGRLSDAAPELEVTANARPPPL